MSSLIASTAPLAPPSAPLPSTTAASTVGAIVAFAVRKGLPFTRIAEATGLDVADLLRPEARIPDQAMGALWLAIERGLPGQAVGLELARQAPLSFLGPVLQVARYAHCARAALEVFLRFRGVVSTDFRPALREEAEETVLTLHHPQDDVAYVGSAPETLIGLSIRFLREELGAGAMLRRVELVHQPYVSRRTYEEAFGVEVRFGHAIVMHTAALDRPLDGGDRMRFDALLAHLDALHQPPSTAAAATDLHRVHDAIAHNARSGEYGAEALARRVGTSLRTLERLARAHGTTVRRLLEEVRESHARRLLRDPRLSVDEISALLGYSAESAFRRAFKRWSGTSPSAFRRGLRGTA